MTGVSQQRSSRWSTTLLGLMVVLFTIALVVYPKQGFEAGVEGLKVFWDIVFPSLLPFFILSELMLGLGIVHGLGVILEPLMRPLFSVPGVGAFALSMGLAAGYPMDAVITARFRETGMCTRIEGERLLAFTNTADPLFMFGAVAVGMFKRPELGVLIAAAHYIAAFLVGVGFKLWGRRAERTAGVAGPANATGGLAGAKRRNILWRAYQEMLRARAEDGRPFGKLLGNAVTESIQTLLMICGFIVFFAVLIQVMHLSGIIRVVGWPILGVYHLFGIHGNLVNPTLAGLLEIDIGTAQTAAVSAPLLQKVALASAIIAWSGLSVHAQVASVLTNTDIRMTPYFLARFLHALTAALCTVVLWGFGLGVPLAHAIAAVAPAVGADSGVVPGGWHVAFTTLSTWLWIMATLLAISLAWSFVRRLRVIWFHARLDRTP
ncbi:MAG: sporulation integral membrane protein YlbJ [Alicyclobacillaceae bacterium]|nr:sporulation integral membrane protein YlbJ [Alicyclobacillaceae bacterium]